jgi:hypothetical protein
MLGVDLGIGLGEAHGAEVLCRVAFALAAERALEVFDPQLGRIVGEGEGSLIKQQFAEMGAFSEAAPLAAASLPGQGLSRSSRMWLVVLGGAALLVLLSRVVTCLS